MLQRLIARRMIFNHEKLMCVVYEEIQPGRPALLDAPAKRGGRRRREFSKRLPPTWTRGRPGGGMIRHHYRPWGRARIAAAAEIIAMAGDHARCDLSTPTGPTRLAHSSRRLTFRATPDVLSPPLHEADSGI